SLTVNKILKPNYQSSVISDWGLGIGDKGCFVSQSLVTIPYSLILSFIPHPLSLYRVYYCRRRSE
ncbi:MAG: hypothetical protein ACRC8K_26730, partial [Waterburya sp.]